MGGFYTNVGLPIYVCMHLGSVVRKVDSAIHQIVILLTVVKMLEKL